MRIMHTGDWHLGKMLETKSRLDEQRKFIDDFVKLLDENNVDLVLLAGDVYDTTMPQVEAEKLFYEGLKRMSCNGKRMIVVIAGNHDNPSKLASVKPLASSHGVIIVDSIKTVIEVGEYGKNKVLDSGEGFVEVEINGEKAVILTVPHVTEKGLGECIYNIEDDEEDKAKIFNSRIVRIFNVLEKKYRADTINLVIGHLFIVGNDENLDGTERNLTLGGSFLVDGVCFPKNADYIALGHIHKNMIVRGTKGKARYSGSPIHYRKTELSYSKKCILVEIKASEEAIITNIDIPVYKKIEVWKCKSVVDAIEMCEERKDDDCWVYLEIETKNNINSNEIKKMKGLKSDILEIRPVGAVQNSDFEEEEEIEFKDSSEENLEELFRGFYKSKRNLEANDGLVELFLEIYHKE